MIRSYTTAEILAAYADHPLSYAAIMERINRQKAISVPLCELDLALDPIEYITDQNHIGGAKATLRLGAQVKLSSDDHVLDLGCGLGGPARLIADIYGCHVHGIDANCSRIEDAQQLTSLVNLSERVSFEAADFLTVTFSPSYSVIWAQNSWTHVGDPNLLAATAVVALQPLGRVAFEDIYLQRDPHDATERELLDILSDAWRSTFATSQTWASAFTKAGFQILHWADLAAMLEQHLEALTRLSNSAPRSFTANEIQGWRTGLALARSGLISYGRIVARR